MGSYRCVVATSDHYQEVPGMWKPQSGLDLTQHSWLDLMPSIFFFFLYYCYYMIVSVLDNRYPHFA